MAPRFPLPPLRVTESGAPRRIGLELEMIGVDVPLVADAVLAQLGGKLEVGSHYEQTVYADDGLPWRIELDFLWLRERGQGDSEGGTLLGAIDEAAEALVRLGAEQVVPVELVTPPIAMDRMAEVAQLVETLRAAGAQGTRAGWTYAFGMQFNPEMPALDARTIASYLKAFFCLFDWTVERSALDLTRRLSGYASVFPGEYVRKVVDPGYWPAMEVLIDDYLELNPTRNRALDMLPLFAEIDEGRVRARVDDPLIKARPALHYRLPNCEIDREDWNIDEAWLDWLQVEHLAADAARLQGLCTRYVESLERPIGRLFESWSKEVVPWLVDGADL